MSVSTASSLRSPSLRFKRCGELDGPKLAQKRELPGGCRELRER
jgi:hypothetical protein